MHLDVHCSSHTGKKAWAFNSACQRHAALAERLTFLLFSSSYWLLSTWLPYCLQNTDISATQALRALCQGANINTWSAIQHTVCNCKRWISEALKCCYSDIPFSIWRAALFFFNTIKPKVYFKQQFTIHARTEASFAGSISRTNYCRAVSQLSLQTDLHPHPGFRIT